MMKVLVFENRQSQIDSFIENFKQYMLAETDFCDNVSECKSLLSKNEYDLIFLDHDMEDRKPENSGTALVEWWRSPENKNIYTLTIIHSKRKDDRLKFMNDGIINSICIRHVWEKDIFHTLICVAELLVFAEKEKIKHIEELRFREEIMKIKPCEKEK